MTQYGFYFDSSRCTGCKTCELVCKDYHDLGPDILFRRIYDFEGGSWEKTSEGAWNKTAFNYHLAISCNHCDNAACVENCPTGAMQKDEETGLVNSDPEVCIGCGTCRNSCPYDAPRIDAELSRARKCDGCLARVRNEAPLTSCEKSTGTRAKSLPFPSRPRHPTLLSAPAKPSTRTPTISTKATSPIRWKWNSHERER